MALSLDDRLLGEKVHNYCSSSEESEGEGDEDGNNSDTETKQPTATFIPEPEISKYEGTCTNTGPKGVLNDWRRYKQLEAEKRDEAELEKMNLIKKLSITCRSHLDDERERQKDSAFVESVEDLEFFEDEFLKEYRARRIEEMRRAYENVPKFGGVVELKSGQFVDAIDKEHPSVTVIIHIYRDWVPACEAMTGCLLCLAQEYPNIKFCKIKPADARLSGNFAENGVPALLIYKNKELIGNFIRLSDEFGDDFYATDVEAYLLEHGFLPDKTLKSSILNAKIPAEEDSDSDLDLD